jgi:hypothetical protein
MTCDDFPIENQLELLANFHFIFILTQHLYKALNHSIFSFFGSLHFLKIFKNKLIWHLKKMFSFLFFSICFWGDLGIYHQTAFLKKPILVPTCALPIMILSLKITFIHSHHILHLLFYKNWQMNKIDYLLHQLKLKEQYIPHIGSHIVITMNIVLIQIWNCFSKYLLLLLWWIFCFRYGWLID